MRLFEVRRRDGAARAGIFMEKTPTPAVLSVKSLNELFSDVKYKPLPLRIPEEAIVAFEGYFKAFNSQQNVSVGHPHYPLSKESNIYIIGSAIQLSGNARAFTDAVIKIRSSIAGDAALYAPALATPENAAMLIYTGIDLVDEVLPQFLGYNDVYLTQEGEYQIEDLRELPCACSICQNITAEHLRKLPKAKRAELLARHNCLKLDEELRKIREFIRTQSLREYVEGKCRSSPWLTASLRLLDFSYSYLEERTPVARKSTLIANSMESLNRVEVRRFAERVRSRYRSPASSILLLLPCSARKPYSTSLSHSKFIEALGRHRKYVHEAIITSPLGTVPRELEIVYPAAHYEVAVTGIWDLEERRWVESCLYDFLTQNKYEKIIAHIEGAYKEICRSVETKLKIEIEYTALQGKRLTSSESLDNLNRAVERAAGEVGKQTVNKLDIVRAVACYQFGLDAGRVLIGENIVLKGNFPKWQIFDGKKQLGTLNPATGLLSLSLDGGKRVEQFGYIVEIDAFLPKGSILVPGIIKADPQIREGDEVVVRGARAFGVGRALMSSWEMTHSRKGAAVELRHVEAL